MSSNATDVTIKTMLDIREEIHLLLFRRGLSFRKLAQLMHEQGYDIPVQSGLSDRLLKKRIRFETVQEILDYLGYELKIVQKQSPR